MFCCFRMHQRNGEKLEAEGAVDTPIECLKSINYCTLFIDNQWSI